MRNVEEGHSWRCLSLHLTPFLFSFEFETIPIDSKEDDSTRLQREIGFEHPEKLHVYHGMESRFRLLDKQPE